MQPMLSTANYTLRGNVITLHRSDGNRAYLPTRQECRRVVMEGDFVDYMHECTGNDPTLLLWKTKIGTFLAQYVLNLPDARNRRKYILSSLPEGYGLYLHRKGDKDNPRQDAYLRGSTKVHMFRSPAEFFFHAKWLLLGCPTPGSVAPKHNEELWGPALPEEITDRCACTYCANTSQEYISTTFSNYMPPKRPRQQRGGQAPSSSRIQAKFEGSF